MTPVILTKAKDNAEGLLDAGINASVLTIPLESGDGANFPQPYTGTASSAGSRTALNDTGDLANLAVKDFIRNVTDGSWAFVVTGGTNSIVTTRLQGGSDNTWDSGDVWRVNEFVGTLAKINAEGDDTQYEEVLISNRSTDTLTVPTGGRGYNSTVAQAFDAGDHFQLRVTGPNVEELKGLLKELIQQVDTNTTDIATLQTDMTAQKTGSYHYVVSGGSSNAYTAATPALGSYAAGNFLRFKANHTNTGAATINVNSLGAKTIKRRDGATDVAAGDIVSGQLVEICYDGTNFQMLSPPGQVETAMFRQYGSQTSTAGGDTIGNTSTETSFASTVSVASDLVAGDVLEIYAWGYYSSNSSNTAFTGKIRFGSTDVLVTQPTFSLTASQTNQIWSVRAQITVRTAGAAGVLMGTGWWELGSGDLTVNREALRTDWTGTPDPITGFDTSGGFTAAMRIKWETANSNNTMTMQQFNVFRRRTS